MKTLNPYRSNEFCVNWEDNLLATSMGDAYEVGKDDTLRQVRELLDGIVNPYISNQPYWIRFDEAIQTMKALLEE